MGEEPSTSNSDLAELRKINKCIYRTKMNNLVTL